MTELATKRGPKYYPMNYAANMGGWVDWDPVKRRLGHGVFYSDSWLTARKIRDGMSKMLAFAEVKAYTPYERNAAAGGDLLVPASAEDLPAGGGQKSALRLRRTPGIRRASMDASIRPA